VRAHILSTQSRLNNELLVWGYDSKGTQHMKYDGAEVEIKDWEKHNPRKDIKLTVWFRLQNSLFEEPDFFSFTHSELLVWIYLLSMASKKYSPKIRLSKEHIQRIGRFKFSDFESALEKLSDLKYLNITLRERHADVTCTLRECDVDDTLQTNKQDKQDKQTSANAKFDFEEIYKSYPLKKGKTDGISILQGTVKTEEDFEAFRKAVSKYASHCSRNGTDSKYIQHFSTFVGTKEKQRWRDWVDDDAGLTKPTLYVRDALEEAGLSDAAKEEMREFNERLKKAKERSYA
jgi:hypothetical protein